jgi:hypothetical protein
MLNIILFSIRSPIIGSQLAQELANKEPFSFFKEPEGIL